MKLASIFILTTPFVVLIGTAVAVGGRGGQGRRCESRRARLQRDPLRLLLGREQQRQRFAGLSANTVFYNVALGLAMWIGRFWPIVAALAIAGSLAAKKRVPVTEGTMPTHGPLFVALLIGSILLIGVLDLRTGARARARRRALHARGSQLRETRMSREQLSLFDRKLLGPALLESVKKLDPRVQWRNPVMFVVYVGTIVTAAAVRAGARRPRRGVARPSSSRSRSGWSSRCCSPISPRRWPRGAAAHRPRRCAACARPCWPRSSSIRDLRDANDSSSRRRICARAMWCWSKPATSFPVDGEVIEGAASVDESAITGESAPVIRESGGDFASVTGGTRVLSDWIVVRVTVNPGETFLDRMISMVEGAKRQKTPNEIALTILLVALTLVFLVVIVTLLPFSLFSVEVSKLGSPVTITALVSLLVCLIPTTIGGLLSAIGVAGMSRMMQANVIATSGRAVEAAGDVDVLLLDKTGTITLGNRQATAFLPAPGVTEQELADAAQLASLADETPEGRSIVVLAKQQVQSARAGPEGAGCDLRAVLGAHAHERREPWRRARSARAHRMRSASTWRRWASLSRARSPRSWSASPARAARRWWSRTDARVLGVIELKDIVKGGIKERFADLRHMGIKTIMITGDNRLTAAAIAAEAGCR